MLFPNTILRERYRIIHQLGHGGMGAVYQAMDENLSCVVAVKETFAATDEQRRAFRREAELLANLSHAALPRVMDHFTHGEGQFLVMQFVPGHDLAELLEIREQPFAVARVLSWADQLLEALEELHSSDPPVIHRDIKPANLKVTPKGKVLLLDFGLAKGFAGQMSTADAESRGKSIYGYTPHYAPLEQIRGAGTDQRSDLYSLAATLWTLLTGKVPPDALSRVAEKEDGNGDPLRSAHEINPEVPVPISNLLNQAMALNRNQRPATATALRNGLRDAAQAGLEVATLSLPRASAPSPTPLSPVLPPLEPTIKAPEPTSPSSEPASEPALKTPEAALKVSAPEPQSVPTMRVSSPPAVPIWEREVASPTATSRFVEPATEGRFQKRLALFVAGVFVATSIVLAVVMWSGLLPWGGAEQAGAIAPTQTTRPAGTASPGNPVPAGMVYVPGGEFTMGRNATDGGDEYENPAHHVTVKPFFIDLYEVTNEDYKKCVDAQRCPRPESWMKDASYKAGTELQPVTGVTWEAANQYAKWAGKRLPTEEEWEFAARGTDGRTYPWGPSWQTGKANANGESKALAEVGVYRGASQSGAFDMVGNAWEWTASRLLPYPGGRLPEPAADNVRVIRGGSYDESAKEATTTYRGFLKVSGDKYDKTGFRCVKDVGDGARAQ